MTPTSSLNDRTFTTDGPADLYVEIGAGSLGVTADDTPDGTAPTVVVELTGSGAADTHVEERDGRISVVAPRSSGFLGRHLEVHVRLTVPTHSRLVARSGSAGVTATGAYGAVSVETGSGDVRVDGSGHDSLVRTGSGDVTVATADGRLEIGVGSGDVRVGHAAGELLVKTGSGDAELTRVDGPCLLRTGSGDVTVGSSTGTVEAKTGSGRLRVRRAEDDVTYTSGSGDLVVEVIERGALTARTASGAVRGGVPSGVPVWTDVRSTSGRIHAQLEQLGAPADGQPYVEVHATTVSGDVDLRHV